MKRATYGILMFISGVTLGAVITAKLVKKKYEKRANEEIESVREYYASKKDANIKDAENIEDRKSEVEQLDEIKGLDGVKKIDAYSDMIKKCGYVSTEEEPANNSADENTEKKEIVAAKNNTVLITPEELGEEIDETGMCFDIVTLVYYADGVMAYHEDEHLVDDIEDLVGTEFKDHFGDYEEDAVFVRNFRNETDYEIIRDEDKYYDIWPNVRGEEDG